MPRRIPSEQTAKTKKAANMSIPDHLTAETRSSNVQYEHLPRTMPAKGSPWLGALGYRRCRDFDQSNAPGQDYVTVRMDENHVVGILADGVSQSFHGEIAAERVSTELDAYLWKTRANPPSEKAIAEVLIRLADKVRKEIEDYPVHSEKPLLKMALENTRRSGSQAVFAAFILDTKRRNIKIYRVGDIIVQIEPTSGGPYEIIKSNANGRWSTAETSNINLEITECSGVAALFINSDGFPSKWNAGGHTLREYFIHIAEDWAARDDVSFIYLKHSHHEIEYKNQLETIKNFSLEVARTSEAQGATPRVMNITKPLTDDGSRCKKSDPQEQKGAKHKYRHALPTAIAALLLTIAFLGIYVLSTKNNLEPTKGVSQTQLDIEVPQDRGTAATSQELEPKDLEVTLTKTDQSKFIQGRTWKSDTEILEVQFPTLQRGSRLGIITMQLDINFNASAIIRRSKSKDHLPYLIFYARPESSNEMLNTTIAFARIAGAVTADQRSANTNLEIIIIDNDSNESYLAPLNEALIGYDPQKHQDSAEPFFGYYSAKITRSQRK
ncbi:MAG: hypothetical protein HC897_03850 [Thermoanaerobaculia bacterium]|nr:hypothetical protein [Thermoanaerobaculia bacterium]